jgi:hypothetical protein
VVYSLQHDGLKRNCKFSWSRTRAEIHLAFHHQEVTIFLMLRIKALEAENRQLKEELRVAYGKLYDQV